MAPLVLGSALQCEIDPSNLYAAIASIAHGECFSNREVIARQLNPVPTNSIPYPCNSACSSFDNTYNNCGTNTTCLCSSGMNNELVSCLDCLFSQEPAEGNTFQNDLNSFQSYCSMLGYPLEGTVVPTGTGVVPLSATDAPSGCQSDCAPVIDDFAFCGAQFSFNFTCLCTPAIKTDLTNCVNCYINKVPLYNLSGQLLLNAYVNNCTGAGISFPGPTSATSGPPPEVVVGSSLGLVPLVPLLVTFLITVSTFIWVLAM